LQLITFRSILELRELMLSGHIEDKGEDDDWRDTSLPMSRDCYENNI